MWRHHQHITRTVSTQPASRYQARNWRNACIPYSRTADQTQNLLFSVLPVQTFTILVFLLFSDAKTADVCFVKFVKEILGFIPRTHTEQDTSLSRAHLHLAVINCKCRHRHALRMPLNIGCLQARHDSTTTAMWSCSYTVVLTSLHNKWCLSDAAAAKQ